MNTLSRSFLYVLGFAISVLGCESKTSEDPPVKPEVVLNYETSVDPDLQTWLENVDFRLRSELQMSASDTAAGVLDLNTGRLAMVHPDRIEYAASVAKIGILLAWFEAHPEAASQIDPQTEHELGLMVKASSNEMAAKFSRELGLQNIQTVLNRHGFYDVTHGGGLWVGRHYGKSEERYGDPLADHSHAATVRQVLRFYLLLEQGRLVSPEASAVMLRIFDSPAIPHDAIKFVKALSDRGVQIRRKWGTWEDWRHDSAVISGPKRHYILVGLTHHAQGDVYLEKLAAAVDDRLGSVAAP
ncbi:serine hydrolase [Verrucomicrobiota bacterium sgz303538]